MKIKLFSTGLVCIVLVLSAQAATHTITNSGLSFSPDEITIAPGDIVNWSIGDIHNVVEVSKETWDANGSTSNGGFSLDFGGGEVSFNTAGTFYYVCAPHSSSGMKGIIIVEEVVTEIADVIKESFPLLKVFPNPVRNKMSLEFTLGEFSDLKVEIYDVTGRKVQSLISDVFRGGSYSKTFQLEDLKAGRYIVYFRANEEVRVQQISVID